MTFRILRALLAASCAAVVAQAGPPPIPYSGGPIVAHPVYYNILWSTSSVQTYGADIATYLGDVGQLIPRMLGQYATAGLGGYGGNQIVGMGTFGATYAVTPDSNATTVDDTTIQSQLISWAKAGTIPLPQQDPDGNAITLYNVMFPPGTTVTSNGFASCIGFCAYHNHIAAIQGFKHAFYIVLPNMDAGSGGCTVCGTSTTNYEQNLTDVLSHEIYETITDPDGTSWQYEHINNQYNIQPGDEIADVCNGQYGTVIGPSGKPWTMQYYFSNAADSCVLNVSPAITTQPVSQSISPGASASFTAAGTGNPAPTVQWQISTDGGASFSNIPGATSTTLSLTAVPVTASGNQYHAVFTNSTGAVTTDAAGLTVAVVKLTPVITWSNPANIPFGSALSATQLNATANVPGTFTYTPAAGSVLPTGNGQTLSVQFTPTDLVNYNTAASAVLINVIAGAGSGSPANLVLTRTLSRSVGTITMTITISNTGGTAAANVTVTTAKVGSTAATPVPQNLGTIAAGGSATATVTVPGTVGSPGAASSTTIGGSYGGGTFNSSGRVSLP